MQKKLIDIVPLEREGWYLTRQIFNKRGLAAIETKPLRNVRIENEEEVAPKEAEHFVARRELDENGKAHCSHCGKKLGVAKTNYCPNCGSRFVEPEPITEALKPEGEEEE